MNPDPLFTEGDHIFLTTFLSALPAGTCGYYLGFHAYEEGKAFLSVVYYLIPVALLGFTLPRLWVIPAIFFSVSFFFFQDMAAGIEVMTTHMGMALREFLARMFSVSTIPEVQREPPFMVSGWYCVPTAFLAVLCSYVSLRMKNFDQEQAEAVSAEG